LKTQRRPWLLPALVLCFIGISCFLGPLLSPHDPAAINLSVGAQPPSFQHWFGTDTLGRDLLTRTLAGGRTSLLVGLVATLISVVVGTCVGILAGTRGGWLDNVLMRLVEALSALPFTLIVILLMTLLSDVPGLSSFLIVLLVISLVEWLTLARVVRSAALGIAGQPYVSVARQLGQSEVAIMRQHVLPNVSDTVRTYAALTVPSVMLLEAFISFLGLGVKAPESTWGVLIRDGAASMEVHPWLLVFPAGMFVTTLLMMNLLSNRIR
jgi:oligopeptide transport system permease protein